MAYLIKLTNCTNNVVSSIQTSDAILAINFLKGDLEYKKEHSGSKTPYELSIFKDGKPVSLGELEKITARNWI